MAPAPAFLPMEFGMSDPEATALEAANNKTCRLIRDRHEELQKHVREVILE